MGAVDNTWTSRFQCARSIVPGGADPRFLAFSALALFIVGALTPVVPSPSLRTSALEPAFSVLLLSIPAALTRSRRLCISLSSRSAK